MIATLKVCWATYLSLVLPASRNQGFSNLHGNASHTKTAAGASSTAVGCVRFRKKRRWGNGVC